MAGLYYFKFQCYMFDKWWIFKEHDKLLHLFCGIVMSQVLVLVLSICATSIVCPLILSTIISSAVAYGKELLYDKALGHGVYDIKDFIATEIGIGYGIITSLLFLLL